MKILLVKFIITQNIMDINKSSIEIDMIPKEKYFI